MLGNMLVLVIIAIAILIIVIISIIVKWYKKPVHGKALVRTGKGGTRITFDRGFMVIPILHRLQVMDITLKTVTISRTGADGLICRDNMRADIKVSFFVRVNNNQKDATNVATSIGCERASHQETLVTLFDAKFSEALKTVGKKFDFVALYTERHEFKGEILDIIGTNLNGYVLDDCAIDYLEQTPLSVLKQDNILDAEGIKKITALTSDQIILANKIDNDKAKTIKKQDVEARETILELERQLAETEAKQKKEVDNVKNREGAESSKVSEEQRLVAENARISADEAIAVAEQNKERQILVAQRNKEKTDAVELEKLQREKDLQINERERIVSLAQIEKEKVVETEKRNIQEIIRERVAVQKDVVIEEEKIKDTQQFADADRKKRVAVTNAEAVADQSLVRQLKAAEAAKKAAEFEAQKKIVEADAEFATSGKKADAIKIMAEAQAAEAAAKGKGEAQVIEAKAEALKTEGQTEAQIIEMKAVANAKGIREKGIAEAESLKEIGNSQALINKEKGLSEAEVIHAKAKAEKEKGMAEAEVSGQKYTVEATGIEQKAEAMKKLDGVGKEHEEFKLRLQKDKEIELAQISIQKDIAYAQADVIGAAVKSAKIDIVGGETMFFEQIIGSITKGKSIDKIVTNSDVLSDIKQHFIGDGDGDDNVNFGERLKGLIDKVGISSTDLMKLSISALVFRLSEKASDDDKSFLDKLLNFAISKGVAYKPVQSLGII